MAGPEPGAFPPDDRGAVALTRNFHEEGLVAVAEVDPVSLNGELFRLEGAIERSHATASVLGVTLDSVLKDESVVGRAREERDHSTGLAMRVRRAADLVEDLEEILSRYINRIDL